MHCHRISHAPSPAGERGITPREKQRATAGAWVLEPDERGCATILANDGRRIARNRPFGPVASGGDGQNFLDGARSRPCRHAMRTNSVACRGCRSLPLPMSLGGVALATKRAPAVKRERQSESSTAHRTHHGREHNRYGSLSQDLVWGGRRTSGMILGKFSTRRFWFALVHNP